MIFDVPFDNRMLARTTAVANDIRADRPWFRIANAANDSTIAQVDIYDEIWTFGVGAAGFRNDLKALGDGITTIDLHINSPGGDVYEALAIMNTLRQHKAKVVTTIDGLAASSAGFIAVGASDELRMAENSELMAHLPWAVSVGDATDMRKMADQLDRVGANIASIFATRTGGTVEEWMAILTDETWWSAQEAVDAGIADAVCGDPRTKDSAVSNRFDLSIFAHAGRASAPQPRSIAASLERPLPTAAEVTPEENHQPKESHMATLQEGLAELLGVSADSDDETILAAASEAFARTEAEGADADTAEPTLEQATAIAARAGLTTITNEALSALQDQARAGAEARAQQVREGHERIVDAAIEQGRIAPARRDHWLSQLDADADGIRNVIAGLPAVIPVGEIGHSVANEATEDDALYASLYKKGE